MPQCTYIFRLKICSVERDFSPVPGTRLMLSCQWLQLFLWAGRPPASLSQPLGLSQGPITHFQIYFYWHELPSSKLKRNKMAPTEPSPDFHISHVGTHVVSHLTFPSQKINDFSLFILFWWCLSDQNPCLCFSLPLCSFRFYYCFKSLLISPSASPLLPLSYPTVTWICLEWSCNSPGHSKKCAFLITNSGKSAAAFKTLCNSELIYFPSIVLSRLHYNSQGTVHIIRYICRVSTVGCNHTTQCEWCSLKLCNMWLWNPVLICILQTNPILWKRPFSLFIIGPTLPSESCPLINIPSLGSLFKSP